MKKLIARLRAWLHGLLKEKTEHPFIVLPAAADSADGNTVHASAVATVTVELQLGSYGGKWTVEDIREQASSEAVQRMQGLCNRKLVSDGIIVMQPGMMRMQGKPEISLMVITRKK